MKDKILTYAIAASIAAHILVISVVGHSSLTRLSTASAAVPTPKFIKVDFVGDPSEAVKPKPVETPKSEPAAKQTERQYKSESPILPKQTAKVPITSIRPATRQPISVPHTPRGTGHQMPGNPGGKLNIGSTSANGDLGGNWGGGSTPAGWVPGSDDGKGKGSGSGAGEARPDPVKNASDGPGTAPAPAPRTVSVRICHQSGMLAGEYCKSTGFRTYIEGRQPRRVCTHCKPPEHKSRLADQANPILIRDTSVSVPASVDEGLSLVVKVEYTVTDEGSVSGVSVIKSSGYRALDKVVISATSKLKYKPAVQDGTARSVKMTRTYRINT
ncbi:energy transducer TonB [bacterium]|nr:energy transducer TonB [bacterium]